MKTIRRLFLLLSILAVYSPNFAQSVGTAWVRNYNGPKNVIDIPKAITVDDFGNVYVTGYSDDSGPPPYVPFADFATIMYYPNGDTAWIRRYNGPANSIDEAWAIAVYNNEHVYVSGFSVGNNGSNQDYLTIKYDTSGTELWVNRYNGAGNDIDISRAMTIDDSGNVYVTGISWTGIRSECLTIKYYSNGGTAWVHHLDTICLVGIAIAVDSVGNVYTTGQKEYEPGMNNICTIKHLPNGDTAWVRLYGSSEDYLDISKAIAIDKTGNVFVAGYRTRAGNKDCLIIKYDQNGNELWANIYDVSDYEGLSDVTTNNAGYVFATGWSDSGYVTLKYSSNGDSGWARRYARPYENYDNTANAIAIDGAGNIYITGRSMGDTDNDYASLKYNEQFYELWTKRYDGPADYSCDYGTDIALDDSGNVYVAGVISQSSEHPEYFDYNIIKYVQIDYTCGDADFDTIVDIFDITHLINYLYINGPSPYPLESGDVNNDGTVNIFDITYLISYLYMEGPEPDCP